MPKEQADGEVETVTRNSEKTEEPRSWRVLLINDDYTTMEFVVSVLETIFQKPPAEAVNIMLKVHREGRGVCGLFPRQIAEAKQSLVHQQARAEGFPLRCQIEEA